MENEAILDYLIYNKTIYSTTQINPINNINGQSIYEVIRIIDGIPLYLEEHLGRLRKSARLIGVNIERLDKEIIEDIYKLIEKNNEYNLNVKILCGNFSDEIQDIYLYFIKSYYPPKDIYDKGIHTILYRSERHNPHAKTVNRNLREAINRKREEKNAFEALLVNEEGQITEGSRSNLFFVKRDTIYTAPSNKVLLGVTRTKIIDLCKDNNINVVEKDILADKLNDYDGAFITGTSVNVMPIKSIDEMKLYSPRIGIIRELINIYEEDIANYINKRKDK